MRKLEISIDLTAIKGAQLLQEEGRDVIVIYLDESRAKPHQNGKVYFNLEAVENKDGEDKYGNSHFVVEKATREEREERVKLPFLGNAKTFDSEQFYRDKAKGGGGSQRREPQERRQTTRPAPSRTPARNEPDVSAPWEKDDIDF